jgi:multidrug efflux pump subunit AcrB
MFWIVGIALIASWIVAVAFTPYLGVKLLPTSEKVEGGPRRDLRHADVQSLPARARRVIQRKWLVAAACHRLPSCCRARNGCRAQAVFPDLRSSGGARRAPVALWQLDQETSGAARRSEDWLAKQAEAKIVTSYVGQGAPRFYMAMAPSSLTRRSRRSWSDRERG